MKRQKKSPKIKKESTNKETKNKKRDQKKSVMYVRESVRHYIDDLLVVCLFSNNACKLINWLIYCKTL